MEFLYYPMMFEKASYQISGQKQPQVNSFRNTSDLQDVLEDVNWTLNRAELIRGNLTISVSEFEVREQPIELTRRALPVNDMYILDFVLPERNYSRLIDQKVFHSAKTSNHFGFCSSTVQLTQVTDPVSKFYHVEIYTSRSYLIYFLKEFMQNENSSWLSRLDDNDKVFQVLSLGHKEEKMIIELINMFQQKANFSKINANNLVHQVIESFFHHPEIQDERYAEMVKSSDYKKINEAKELIESGLERKFKLEELCQFCNMSPTKFKKMFKSILGKSFTDYYTMVRMEQAIKLLQENKVESFTELSMQLGYKNLSQFTRTFKSYYKNSPTDFFKMKGNRYTVGV